jgi:hypothetical protein
MARLRDVRPPAVRALGLALAGGYACLILWIYISQPRSVVEVRGRVASALGVYTVDGASFEEGLRFFRADKFEEARLAFSRADPAGRDPLTLFYIAYSYLRQGWGRLYADDRLYTLAMETIDRAIAAAPDGRIVVTDDDLALKTADEVKAELARGLRSESADLNPAQLFRSRP